MALNLNTNIVTPEGVEINSGYIRLTTEDLYNGNTLNIKGYLYLSEDAYIQGFSNINTNQIMDLNYITEYDRNTNGVDSLNFAHDVLIEFLQKQGFLASKEL